MAVAFRIKGETDPARVCALLDLSRYALGTPTIVETLVRALEASPALDAIRGRRALVGTCRGFLSPYRSCPMRPRWPMLPTVTLGGTHGTEIRRIRYAVPSLT